MRAHFEKEQPTSSLKNQVPIGFLLLFFKEEATWVIDELGSMRMIFSNKMMEIFHV